MATFKPTSKATKTGGTTSKTFTPTKYAGYNQSKVYGWQAQNKSALDLLNEYYNRINAGEWLSNEDRAKYKSAIDTYTTTGNALRDVSKFYGTKYTDEEEKSWQDSLSSLNKGYTSANDFYNQFADDREYGVWKQGETYKSVLNQSDFDNYYNAGINTANPDNNSLWRDRYTGKGVNNMVTLAESGIVAEAFNNGDLDDPYNSLLNTTNLISSFMSDDEKKVYNYYVGKGDKAKAEEYLNWLTENELKKRQAGHISNVTNNRIGELGTAFNAGMQSGMQGIYNAVQGILNTGNLSQASSMQIATAYNKQDNTGVWGVMNDLANTTGNMVPSIAIGMLNPTAGNIAMGVSAGGNAYTELINEGYSPLQAKVYGGLVGASEALLGKWLGGITSLGGGKGLIQSTLSKVMPAVSNAALRTIGTLGKNMVSEFTEEALQTALEPALKYIATGGKAEWDPASLEEIIYSGFLGALSAGALEGIPTIANGVSLNQASQRTYGAQSPEIVAQALELNPNDKLAKVAQNRLDKGKNVSGLALNELVGNIEQGYIKQDTGKIKSAVENRLTELGERGNVAKISDAIAREQAGEELSLGEKNLIKKSDFGKSVRAELNPETLKSDTEMNRWAESIGTRRLNSDVYSKRPSVKVQTNEGKSSEIGSIKSVEGDVATVELSDGTVAKVGLGKNTQSEVKFNDAKTEEMFKIATERIGKVEGWTVESANAMVTAFEHSSNGLGVSDFTRAWSEAYNIGRNNNSRAQLNHSSYATLLDEATRSNAYNIGKAIYSETRTREQAPTRTTMPISTDTNENISRANIEVKTNDGARARIDAIKSINNDIVTVELNNGKEARIGLGKNEQRDVTFSNPQTEQIFKIATERIGKVEGWTSETASAMINAYNGQNIVAGKFAKGWQAAYNIGRNNNSMAQLNSSPLAMELDAQTRADAYNIGKAIAMTPATVSPNAKYSVTFDEGIDPSTFNKKQKNDIKALEIVSKALGVNVKVFDSPVNAKGERIGKNGSYNPTTRTVEVDLHAGNHGEGIINLTSAHEVTHHMKVVARDQFNNYADAVFETLGEDGKVLIANKLEQLSRNGHLEGMTEEEAYDLAFEEVVADSSERMFVDTDALVKLAETLKKKDKSLWQKFKDAVVNILNKLKKAYAELNPQSEAAQTLMNAQDKLEKIQKLWVEGVVAAAEVSDQVQAELGIEIDTETESVSPTLMSERTWTESEYVVNRDAMAKKIASALNISERKAKKYIDDVNSIARMIANDRARLDYQASSFGSAFVSNVEYGGSFDYTTLCKKRRLYTGTFSEIQKRLHDVALTPDEILTVRNMLIEAHKEATCGLCYVEGSRANMGKFAQKFIELYKRDNPDGWTPNMADVNTPDGVEQMRINHPEAYEQYEYFWNHYGKLQDSDPALFASQQKPKLYEARKEYKGEILTHFKADNTITKKNLNGGVRMQSFSDFEVIHLIDTMQVIMDMSTVGLAGQAYTKVPEFALAFGNTGLKINLSLIAKGVDENGKLIFDDREGMPHETAFDIRNKYSKNVGTIIVTFTDEQLLAAMADERIDYIIPFHRSQWKKGQYNAMGLPKGTKDYTYMQNEKLIKKTYHEYRGKMVADKATNYMPNEYWDFSKSGKENAEAYLKMCAENNKRPKFYKLLDYDGVGTYSLKADGSTDGYWKLLIDFKMYDNDGVGSPQTSVAPIFNMDEATKMMEEYKGGHEQYPIAHDVVDKFVEQYNKDKGTKYSDRTTETNQDRLSDEESFSNRSILANALASTATSDEETELLKEYQKEIAKLDANDVKIAQYKSDLKALYEKEQPNFTVIKELNGKIKKLEGQNYYHDKKLLQLESTTALKNVLKRARKDSYAKAMQKGKELMHKNVEGRYKTIERNKIKKIAHELDTLLNKGNKKRNVKIGAQGVVRAALDLSDMYFTSDDELVMNGIKTEATDKEASAMEQYKELYEKLHATDDDVTNHKEERAEIRHEMNELKKDFAELLERERKRINKAKAKDSINALATAYAELQKSDDVFIRLAYKPEVKEHLDKLATDLGDTLAKDMTLEQLGELYDTFKMIKHLVTSSNKLFRNGKSEDIQQRIVNIFKELSEVGKENRKDLPELLGKILDKINKLGWDNLRPVDVFELLSSEGLEELFWDAVSAQDVYANDVVEFYNELEKARIENGYKTWDISKTQTFKTADGREFKLTLGNMMSIYAYSKRPQADEHLRVGGIQFKKQAVYKDEKGITRVRSGKEYTYLIDDSLRLEIISKLTQKQKSYVDTVQNVLTEWGKKGNEVSRTLYGIDLFKEKNYFTLLSSHDYLSSSTTELGKTVTTASLVGSGFAKSTTPHANNPIILDSFDAVVLEHIDKMSKYHAYVVPIENLRKVLDAQITDSSNQMLSLKATISARFGDGATKYLEQYITDLNGGIQPGYDNGLMGLFGKAKGAQVMANLSVWAQQYFSVIRAMNEINPKYFTPFVGESFTQADMKLYEEMKKYAPITVIKEMGGFDVGSNSSVANYVGYNKAKLTKDKVAQKVQDAFGVGANVMDKLGWMTIWKAVKKEVAATKEYTLGSKEFYNACGKRMNEVITKTQVYDSVNARSGNMRKKSDWWKMATSFMGEPTTIVGMAEVALIKAKRAIANGDKSAIQSSVGKLVGTMTVLTISTAMTSIAKSLIYAMRDDDEDETYWEKYASALAGAFKDDLNLMGYLPIARDIKSIIEGYSVERPDMTLIEDFINAGKKILDKDEDESQEQTIKEWHNFAWSVANVLGIPMKNIIRDLLGLWGTVQNATNGYDMNISGAIKEGWAGKENTKSYSIYDAEMRKDSNRINYYKSTYKDEDAYYSALRKAIRENDPRVEQAAKARLDGDNDTYYNLMYDVIGEGNFDSKLIKDAFKAEYEYLKDKKKEAEAKK